MTLHSVSNKNLYRSPEFKAFEREMRQLLKKEIEQIQKIYRLAIQGFEKQIEHLENEKLRNMFKMEGEVRAKINNEIEFLQNQIEVKTAEEELEIIKASQRCEERIWITWVNFLARG